MVRSLMKIETLDVEGQTIAVRFYELRTQRGGRRYSAEILLGPNDHIILDDDSMVNLEARATRLVPATVFSRNLARANAA
jgi:hypothetical protein